MNKLEVGMYVRTKYGIDKIKFISEVMVGLDETLSLSLEKELEEVLKRDILKASHNIIDLIEEGDYVNGKQVIRINTDYIFDYSEEFKMIYFSENDYIYSKTDIKSIVTKEQFESMSYKVGE